MDSEKLFSEVIALLKQFGIEKIILFGSYAYGSPTKDSDIDLLVIKDIPETETRDFRIKDPITGLIIPLPLLSPPLIFGL